MPGFNSSSCFEWDPRDWPRCTGWVPEGGCSPELDSPELGEEEGEAQKKKEERDPDFCDAPAPASPAAFFGGGTMAGFLGLKKDKLGHGAEVSAGTGLLRTRGCLEGACRVPG